MLRIFSILVGILLCLGAVLDAFQTIILPRRPQGRFRITRLFYVTTWRPWVAVAKRVKNSKAREQMYSIFGPVSLLFLLMVWAVVLTVGFALVLFGLRSPFADTSIPPGDQPMAHLRTDLYVSGTTLTTLGPGDVVPRSQIARALMILESGTGLGFVALVIGYVPVLYGAFSRREVSVALLDARGGSPPTAAELLRRHGFEGGQEALIDLLAEWERWSAELLESHISYPILCYYRSQHDNQSWLSAMVSILDVCALLITTIEGQASRQAQLTFSVSRHALVDIGHVFGLEPREEQIADGGPETDRLNGETFGRLCDAIAETDIRLCADPDSARRLGTIRKFYEPQAQAISEYLRMELPLWVTEPKSTDQWRKVDKLRSAAKNVFAGVRHVSADSAAARLFEDDRYEL